MKKPIWWIIIAILVLLLAVGFLIHQKAQPRTPTLPTPPLKELAHPHNLQLGNFAILTRLGEKPYRDGGAVQG